LKESALNWIGIKLAGFQLSPQALAGAV